MKRKREVQTEYIFGNKKLNIRNVRGQLTAEWDDLRQKRDDRQQQKEDRR